MSEVIVLELAKKLSKLESELTNPENLVDTGVNTYFLPTGAKEEDERRHTLTYIKKEVYNNWFNLFIEYKLIEDNLEGSKRFKEDFEEVTNNNIMKIFGTDSNITGRLGVQGEYMARLLMNKRLEELDN